MCFEVSEDTAAVWVGTSSFLIFFLGFISGWRGAGRWTRMNRGDGRPAPLERSRCRKGILLHKRGVHIELLLFLGSGYSLGPLLLLRGMRNVKRRVW